MSLVDRMFPPKASPSATSARGAVEAPAGVPPELLQRRDRLAEELATLQWDLGGLAYEMAIRDHFRLDVLVRAAARLQEVDAELGEVERLLRLEESGAAGACPACGALHSRGATFCWQCGGRLMEVATPEFHQPVTEPSHPASEAIR